MTRGHKYDLPHLSLPEPFMKSPKLTKNFWKNTIQVYYQGCVWIDTMLLLECVNTQMRLGDCYSQIMGRNYWADTRRRWVNTTALRACQMISQTVRLLATASLKSEQNLRFLDRNTKTLSNHTSLNCCLVSYSVCETRAGSFATLPASLLVVLLPVLLKKVSSSSKRLQTYGSPIFLKTFLALDITLPKLSQQSLKALEFSEKNLKRE